MQHSFDRKIRALQVYALISTMAILALGFMIWKQQGISPRELSVERINIIEEDGTVRLVLSNKKRQHPGRMDGKDLQPREREAGMIFFNDEGDECGGLVYSGNKKEAGMVLSVDQYKNDQVLQLQYNQDDKRSYGLRLWDRNDDMPMSKLIRVDDSLKRLNDPAASQRYFNQLAAEGKLGTDRLFLGRAKDSSTGLVIRDSKGKVRIRLEVDKNNRPVFQLIDTAGEKSR